MTTALQVGRVAARTDGDRASASPVLQAESYPAVCIAQATLYLDSNPTSHHRYQDFSRPRWNKFERNETMSIRKSSR